MITQRAVDELVRRAEDDWIQAAEVVSVVRELIPQASEDVVRRESLTVVRALLTEGLMRAGVVTDRGFVAWQESPAALLSRIESSWPKTGLGPDLGEVCWFELAKT